MSFIHLTYLLQKTSILQFLLVTPCPCVIYGAVAMKPGSFRLSSAFVKGREQNKIVRPTEKNDRGEGKRRQSDNDFARSKDPRPPRRTDDVDEIPRPFLFLA